MNPTITVGLISLMIIPREGTCGKVNLTAEVEKYILGYIGSDLVDFSLKGGLRVRNELPSVTAAVQQLTYEDGCQQASHLPSLMCSDFYMWYIYNGIVTPFNLPVNITVTYKGKKRETFLVDINNAAYVNWNPENLTMPLQYSGQYSEVKCNFSIEVTFTGKFTYKVKTVKGDKPNVDSHGIGMVARINSKFIQSSDLSLAYNISGVFQHTVICHSQIKTK